MSRILSRNIIKLVAFTIIFLSSEAAFCGNDTIPSSPQSAREWFAKGNAVADLGQFEEAIICYEQVIKLNLNDAAVYYNLGIAYADGRHDYDKAIEYYKKAIELSPDYADAYNNLGLVYQDGKQNYDKAIECFEKAIKLDSKYTDAYYNLGLAYAILGNGKKAIECLVKAAKLGGAGAQRWLRERDIPWEESSEQ